MSGPKISIVTPSLNQAGFLEETITSVLDQGYDNLEYVVIDGGSIDGSADIIAKYQDRLHYWVSEQDSGHASALNKGFSRTSGEIMAWLNSDDKYTPWSFKAVAEIFTRFPQIMWIVGFNAWWNSAGIMTHASREPKHIYDFLVGDYAWIQQESIFWRRDLWNRAGGYIDENYRFMVDGELWTRFFLHEPLYSVDSILSGYRMYPQNRARQHYQSCVQEMEQAIAAMKNRCPKNVQANLERLNLVRRVGKLPLARQFSLARLLRGFAFPTLSSDLAYPNIFFDYDSGNWKEQRLPYSF